MEFEEAEDCGMAWPADLADRVVAGGYISFEMRIQIGELTGIILWPLTQMCGVDRRRISSPDYLFLVSIRLALIGWI